MATARLLFRLGFAAIIMIAFLVPSSLSQSPRLLRSGMHQWTLPRRMPEKLFCTHWAILALLGSFSSWSSLIKKRLLDKGTEVLSCLSISFFLMFWMRTTGILGDEPCTTPSSYRKQNGLKTGCALTPKFHSPLLSSRVDYIRTRRLGSI